MKRYLVTGAAGFIGFHVSSRLLERGDVVFGVDNLNHYYDVNLKKGRLSLLENHKGFAFREASIADAQSVGDVFRNGQFDVVINLAAQAGVRYSLENPAAYIESNLVGFGNVLECCRQQGVSHLVYASSSSVYGGNKKLPFSTDDPVDHPVSLYAASKKSNELMAHAYSHLFSLPTTGLRFFTVYGPWGRPDMAAFLFTKAILAGQPIKVFNHGKMQRDFTYIDDIVTGVVRIADTIPTESSGEDRSTPYRVYNIGNNQPVELLRFIEVIEEKLGREAIKEFLPLQPGDVPSTCADISHLQRDIGFRPNTSIESGVNRFVDWYLEYFEDGSAN
jgi:UDP-glucuronate 4-epimerase